MRLNMRRFLRIKNFLHSNIIESRYVFFLKHYKLDTQSILIELHGMEKTDEIIIGILENIVCMGSSYNIYVVVDCVTRPIVTNILKGNNIKRIQLLNMGSDLYWRVLATAKYLINDYMFPERFVKRDNQNYLYISEPILLRQVIKNKGKAFWNCQRNILLSDYLFFENEKSKYQLESTFFLKNLYRGKYVVNDYQIWSYTLAIHNICKDWLNESNTYMASYSSIQKDDVFIFIDKLDKNGITSAAINLLNSIDLKKRNYTVIFREYGSELNQYRLKEIPVGCNIISLGLFDRTIIETIASFLYFKMDIQSTWVIKKIKNLYIRMFQKYYQIYKDDFFIHFTGYGKDPLHLFLQAHHNIVFVHNDMKKELEKKSIQHRNTLIFCYQNYDIVVGINNATMQIAAKLAENIGYYKVVHNCFDYQKVIMKSKLPIQFDSDTKYINGCNKNIKDVLCAEATKFITIGRFSQEKQHRRLLDAFSLYAENHKEAQLVIIGGYGPEYEKTVTYSKHLNCYRQVTIIKSMSNPMPILKRCDVFILSSSHEGLPIVLFEADCLHKPIISTNIEGPRELLSSYCGGYLADETATGLYQGMLAYDQGEVDVLNIDMNAFNEKCVREFESIFKLHNS